MKLNSKHLFELNTLETNAIWRMQYFSCYYLNATKCEFNIGTVNAVQKKLV